MKKRVDLLKRTFDLVTTFFVLLLLLPVLMLIALMTRIKLGSPIFFKQSRLGLNGNIFNLNKHKYFEF